MDENLEKKEIQVEEHFMFELFGNMDENIKIIESSFDVSLVLRNDKLIIVGEKENVDRTEKLIEMLKKTIELEGEIKKQNLIYAIDLAIDGREENIERLLNDIVVIKNNGMPLKPKTIGQKRYLDNIRSSDIVFGIGPAGTGKTYLAMAMAIRAFKHKEVDRIILTRPAVEAGENLGFLPGDLQEKIDPYLRPMYDALFDILGAESSQKYQERGLIEVAPLAYMRGRTLDSSFIILDEAQNTTSEQMKMFLTRIGNGSKAIITGDITQIDLPGGKKSGLKQAEHILRDVDGIKFSYFDKADVVRHRLVQKIIEAYENFDKELENKKGKNN